MSQTLIDRASAELLDVGRMSLYAACGYLVPCSFSIPHAPFGKVESLQFQKQPAMRQLAENSYVDRIRTQSSQQSAATALIAGVTYSIPQNYANFLPGQVLDGGFELTLAYPGLTPITIKSPSCYGRSMPSHAGPCYSIHVALSEAGTTATSAEGFDRSRAIFRNNSPATGPCGFERYHIGPYEDAHSGKGDPGINIYKKVDGTEVVVLFCIEFPGMGREEGSCQNEYLLRPNTMISYKLLESNICDAEAIQIQLRRLMASFSTGRH